MQHRSNTPAEDFRHIRIAAAAYEMQHFLAQGVSDDLVHDWFRNFHGATWRCSASQVAVQAYGIDAIGETASQTSAAAVWIERARQLTEGTPLIEPLAGFIAIWGDRPLDEVTRALHDHIDQGDGSWMRPDPGLHSPGTCFHEIDYLGVTAWGHDETEAVRDWLKVARASLQGEAAA